MRQSGFYWVKRLCGYDWEVAQWLNICKVWLIVGDSKVLFDDEMSHIGSRISEPWETYNV